MHAKMTCGLKVDTDDPGWYTYMTKFLSNIKGASYTINVEEGMAYITGRVNPSKLLKKLNSGRYADLCWVRIGNQITYEKNPYNQGMQLYGVDGSQKPAADYWHNNYYDPMHHPHVPYYPQTPMLPYPYHNFQTCGYWDRGVPHWDH